MTFLPIVERELIEASRRRGTYWIRVGAAAAGLIIGGWVMLIPDLRTAQHLGMALFVPLSIVTFIYCWSVGVFRTADCLSEEKREGTLGLLFLTDLKGYDIVLGKLVATSINAFYGILAIFPVMAIPLLVGGVTFNEFWRVVLAAVNMMFFSLAVGMFSSSISRDERRAMVAAFLILLFFLAGIPLIGAILHDFRFTRGLGELFVIPSPYCSAIMSFEAVSSRAARGGNPDYYFPSVTFIFASSIVLLLLASRIVPRTWQDRALTPGASRRREKWNRLGLGSPETRRRLRQRMLSLNPFYWLVGRHRMKIVAVWALIALGAGIWCAGLAANPRDWKDEVAYFLTAIIAHTIFKYWVVTEACRRFSLDRQSGALELILSTPLSVKEIIRGQWLALERQFAVPVFVVLLVDFVFLMSSRHDQYLIWTWIAGMVVFLVDVVTLSWLGMWRGLNSRRPNRAAAASLVRILFLPWMVFFLFMTLSALFDSFGKRSGLWDSKAPVFVWTAISLGFAALFGLPARRKLLTKFRDVATQRFETRGGGRGK